MIECSLCSCRELKEMDIDYLECSGCSLIIRKERLSLEQEKLRYSKHKNSLSDSGYRRFLEKLWKLLLPLVDSGDVGLDYGCGEVRNMELIAAENSITVDSFDPFFHNRELRTKYDFIILNEVIEHIYDQNEVLEELVRMLSTKGHLAIQTSIYTSAIDFKNWHYRRDPTHVSIYQENTIKQLSRSYPLRMVAKGKDCFIFEKT